MSRVHAQARTTPLTRTEIRDSELGVVKLAERYNISRSTASKWKNREDVQDRSHRPHKLSTTLSEGQEALVAEVRRLTLIPLDDLLVVVREFINPAVSRSGLDRYPSGQLTLNGPWPAARMVPTKLVKWAPCQKPTQPAADGTM